ncbi:hypothetical protein Tco_0569092 [Tanacetum coccineum]
MLYSMTPDLQKNLENYNACDLLQELKTMFQQQADQELFETVKPFHACRHEEGQSLNSYILKMMAYLDQLERLHEVCLLLYHISRKVTNSYDGYFLHQQRKLLIPSSDQKSQSYVDMLKSAKNVQEDEDEELE